MAEKKKTFSISRMEGRLYSLSAGNSAMVGEHSLILIELDRLKENGYTLENSETADYTRIFKYL